MCSRDRWLHSLSLITSLVQSVVWIVLSAASALVYLCVITVSPYKDKSDFFRVTIVKLYFEGPECIPDGSYLGKFNEDYRNPDVLKLFTPDKVFAVMVTYFILNVIYCFFSLQCWINRKSKTSAQAVKYNDSLKMWSLLTIIISGIDAGFTVKMVYDVISLKDYMDDKDTRFDVTTASASINAAEIPYIPLMLALVSSRLIGIWLWNVFIGLTFFLSTLCRKSYKKDPQQSDRKVEIKRLHEELETSTKDRSTSMDFVNRAPKSSFEELVSSDHSGLKRSMEAVTRFNAAPKTIYPRENLHNWSYTANESYWSSLKPHSSKDEWEKTNEGFVDDDQILVKPETTPDFDHDLKNFDHGQSKIKIVKPPIGKPVSIPVPPPLPVSGSCNC